MVLYHGSVVEPGIPEERRMGLERLLAGMERGAQGAIHGNAQGIGAGQSDVLTKGRGAVILLTNEHKKSPFWGLLNYVTVVLPFIYFLTSSGSIWSGSGCMPNLFNDLVSNAAATFLSLSFCNVVVVVGVEIEVWH